MENILPAVTCSALSLTNGQVTYDESAVTSGEYPVGTVATFRCDHGYSSSGSTLSTCETSTSWDQETPTCNQSIRNNDSTFIIIIVL